MNGPPFSYAEFLAKLSQLNSQAQQIEDQTIKGVILDLTYWILHFVNDINLILPKLPLLESSFNQQIKETKHQVNQIEVDLHSKLEIQSNRQPKIKSNIIQILEESFGIVNCLETIKQQAQISSDQKCIDVIQSGFFYPKMLKYLAEKLNKNVIVYNAKKKRYFKYGQSQESPIFLFQKNSQIFNVMRKKNKVEPLNHSNNSSTRQQPNTSQKQQNLIQEPTILGIQQSIKKQIDTQIKEALNKSILKAYQTPNKSSNKKNALQEQEIEIIEEFDEGDQFCCGGNMKTCSNSFNDLDDYQIHIRKVHKVKVPKKSTYNSWINNIMSEVQIELH